MKAVRKRGRLSKATLAAAVEVEAEKMDFLDHCPHMAISVDFDAVAKKVEENLKLEALQRKRKFEESAMSLHLIDEKVEKLVGFVERLVNENSALKTQIESSQRCLKNLFDCNKTLSDENTELKRKNGLLNLNLHRLCDHTKQLSCKK